MALVRSHLRTRGRSRLRLVGSPGGRIKPTPLSRTAGHFWRREQDRGRRARANTRSCSVSTIEPVRYAVTFADPPLPDLLQRLRPVLAAQGSPPIEATADGATVVFAGATGEFMV